MQRKSLTRQGVSSSLYQWCSGKSKIPHLSKVNDIILSTMQNCKKGNISAGRKWLRYCCFFVFFCLFQKLQNGHNLQSLLMQVHKIDSKVNIYRMRWHDDALGVMFLYFSSIGKVFVSRITNNVQKMSHNPKNPHFPQGKESICSSGACRY